MRLDGAGKRYEDTADSFGVPDDPRVLRKMTLDSCLRLCITAISIACVAFHQAYDEFRWGSTQEAPYPSDTCGPPHEYAGELPSRVTVDPAE